MILEVAILDVIPGMEEEFEDAFSQARHLIAGVPGHRFHQLQKCIEKRNRYILLVNWERLENHTIDFRQSDEYKKWSDLLHHFYEPFPEVDHYQVVSQYKAE